MRKEDIARSNQFYDRFISLILQSINVLDLLQQMNTQLAAHTHVPGPAPSPTDAAAFTAKAAQATVLASKLKAITG